MIHVLYKRGLLRALGLLSFLPIADACAAPGVRWALGGEEEPAMMTAAEVAVSAYPVSLPRG